MRPLNDFSDSFHLPGSNKSFLAALKPDEVMMGAVQEAEQAIKAWLRTEIPRGLASHLPPTVTPPRPKFLLQGSRAYGTLNDALRDSQHYCESDSDLGLYVPLESLKNCSDSPTFTAQLLLDVVQTALEQLSERRGWKVKRKTCCIRVKVRRDAHVDVTSYVVPEAEYKLMAKSVAYDRAINFSEGQESDEITWDEIPAKPHLATENGWQRSDAKSIHNKIENAAALLGPIYKRIVRFVKALRDYEDDDNGPCSIGITLIIADGLDPRVVHRDDLAVLSMLGTVADGLLQRLPTPGNEDIDILQNLSAEMRTRLADMLRNAQHVMNDALYRLNGADAYKAMQSVFGSRFPDTSVQESASPAAAPARSVIVTASGIAASAPRGNAKSA